MNHDLVGKVSFGDSPHYLLGTQTTSSTPVGPCWRHLFGVISLPWLQDHTVHNLKVLPGAAYVCMAVEAPYRYCVYLEQSFEVHMEKRKMRHPILSVS